MPTKVAIIGAGGMLQYHAAGFQLAGAEIVAIADMNAEAAAKAAKEWKAPQSYGSVDCLLYTSPSPRDATLSRMPSSA